MNEDRFWKIIEDAGSPDNLGPDEQCENIAEALSGMDLSEIASFHNTHRQILNKAYTWGLIEACYILTHYVSDDVFEDFRNWIILNGKDRFYSSIETPDFLASFVSVEDPVEEITGEPLLYVCEEAYDGDVEELEEHYKYPLEPEIKDNWPPVDVLQSKYPNLFNKYWDESVDYSGGS